MGNNQTYHFPKTKIRIREQERREMGITKNQSILIGINTQTFAANVEVASTHTAVLSGPTEIPNLTVNGVLNVVGDLDVTGNTTIGSSGSINLTG